MKNTLLTFAFATALFDLTPASGRAQTVAIEKANKAQIAAATDYYERGVTAFDSGNASEALEQFTRSNDIVSSPNSRMMMGRALIKLGRLSEAYEELLESIKLSGGPSTPLKKYRQTAETAQRELSELNEKLAFVTTTVGAKVRIQGQAISISRTGEPIPVMPGIVVVEVTFDDGKPAIQQLNLKPGEHSEIELKPPAQTASVASQAVMPTAPPVKSNENGTPGVSPRTLGYVVGMVGIVGLGAFVGFGLVGASSVGNPKDGCMAQLCTETALNHQGTKSLFQGIGYSGLAIGVIGVGTGTWLILGSRSSDTPTASLQVGPLSANVTASF
jgi:hypothetical protein